MYYTNPISCTLNVIQLKVIEPKILNICICMYKMYCNIQTLSVLMANDDRAFHWQLIFFCFSQQLYCS